MKATIEEYGDLVTDRRTYGPLDEVVVKVKGREKGDQKCRISVFDSELKPYFKAAFDLNKNRGRITFPVGGSLGVHRIFLYFSGSSSYSRSINFLVDCETSIETGNSSYDSLYPITKEAMLLGRREFSNTKGNFVGYIAGDSETADGLFVNGIWLRDWIYQLPAYKYWEKELTCGLDRFFEVQKPDGSIPDGVEQSGKTWRMVVEADVEYILVKGVYETWKLTGDDSWLGRAMPFLEKALKYICTDKNRWDKNNRLVKRGHTCDTWDFDIELTHESIGRYPVVATCDQTGYYFAYKAMAEMYENLDKPKKAKDYKKKAAEYRKRVNRLLWDGSKYLHHSHLVPLDHKNFDESEQLAMGNTWAITRGLADHKQAVSIIEEYKDRHKKTKDAFPWWSLQPGYPDELEYFGKLSYCKQGGYANGGLMPWVGGELCLAAFENGMEDYAIKLYAQYIDHLERSGNQVQVWYWPDGTAGFRTTNEVPYTGWGMAQWLQSLVEGLAGLKDESGLMKRVKVSPRWTVSRQKNVKAIARYEANKSYFAYRMKIEDKKISIEYAGSGKRAKFSVLMPKGKKAKKVVSNGKSLKFKEEKIEQSTYLNFSLQIKGVNSIDIFYA